MKRNPMITWQALRRKIRGLTHRSDVYEESKGQSLTPPGAAEGVLAAWALLGLTTPIAGIMRMHIRVFLNLGNF